MGATRTRAEGIAFVIERPFYTFLLGVGLYLAVDLLLQLVGIEVTAYGVQLAGGYEPLSSLTTKVVDGLLRGLVIGLSGIGLSMTYSILGFANFAHGDFITTGAFVGTATSFVVAGVLGGGNYDIGSLALVRVNSADLSVAVLSTPIAIVVGLLAAGLVTIAVVLAVDRLAFEPVRDRGGITLLITSIGVAFTLRYLVNFVFGTAPRNTYQQSLSGEVSLDVVDGTVFIDGHDVLLFVVAVGLMLGVHVLLQRTKLGKAMRAMSDNEDLARVTGIPTERVITFTWVLGGGLTGVAGYVWVLWRGIFTWFDGWLFLLFVFAAVILGGIGSIYGAMAGGVVIGVAANLSTVYVPGELSRASAFLLMIVVLIVAPSGLFKGRTTA